ncbi:MAG: hypothetical protein M3R38_17995 [Actinomycetota bacterium]|nr:hypothetical protein [Actinomycetota bacterium]
MGESDHDRDGGTHDTTPTGRERLTVSQAAAALGISAEAVRQRIKRGTIEHEKVDGTVYVSVVGDGTRRDTDTTNDRTELVDRLRDEVRFLRNELRERDERHAEEVRRRDHLLAAALERIPELEAASPPEPPGEPESAAEAEAGGTSPNAGASPQTATQRRSSWWRRLIGG